MGVSLDTQVQIVSLGTLLQMCFLQDSQTTWIYPDSLMVPKLHMANPKCNDSNLTSWPKKWELPSTTASCGLSPAEQKPHHTSQSRFLRKYGYENKWEKRRGHPCAMNFTRLSVTPSQLPRVHKSQTQKLTLSSEQLPPRFLTLEGGVQNTPAFLQKSEFSTVASPAPCFLRCLPFPLSILKISWSPPLYFWKIYYENLKHTRV